MECERDMKGLTKRQEDVMNILWDAKEPIIASEIVKTGTDLNINTVQAALRSLIKKNYIEVAESYTAEPCSPEVIGRLSKEKKSSMRQPTRYEKH